MKEFGAPPKRPYLTEVADAIENSGKPIVAAHGRIGDAADQLGISRTTLWKRRKKGKA